MIAYGWIYTEVHGAPDGKVRAALNYVKDEHGYLQKKISKTVDAKDVGRLVDWCDEKLGGQVQLEVTPVGFRIVSIKKVS